MAFDFKSVHAGNIAVQTRQADIYIEYPLAVFTHEVTVCMAIVVIARRAEEITDVQQFPGLRHLGKISVHRGPADGGVPL